MKKVLYLSILVAYHLLEYFHSDSEFFLFFNLWISSYFYICFSLFFMRLVLFLIYALVMQCFVPWYSTQVSSSIVHCYVCWLSCFWSIIIILSYKSKKLSILYFSFSSLFVICVFIYICISYSILRLSIENIDRRRQYEKITYIV
jgi:hypothetical protein